MFSHIDLSDSSFPIPNETAVQIFSFLEKKELGRLAQVCQRFKSIAEDNQLWKPLYLRKWKINYNHLFSERWKIFFKRSQNLFNNMNRDPESKNYALFWGQGFSQHAIHLLETSVSNQKTFRKDNLNLAEMYAVIGEREKSQKCLESIKKSNNDSVQLHSILIDILDHLNKKDFEFALSIYQTYRNQLISLSPVIGWWLYNLIKIFHSEEKLKGNQLFLPKTINPFCYQYVNFFRGASFAWIYQNKEDLSLTAVKCQSQLNQRIKEQKDSKYDKHEETLFFENFIDTCYQKNLSWKFFERLGDIVSYIDNPKIRAEDLYLHALKTDLYISLEKKSQLVTKLTKALVDSWKKLHKKDINASTLKLIFNIFNQSVASESLNKHKLIYAFCDLVVVYKLTSYYHYFSKMFNDTQHGNLVSEESMQFYKNKVKLHIFIKDYVNAVYAWVNFCFSINDSSKTESDILIDIYSLIYQVLEISEEACQIIISIKSNSVKVLTAAAYAHHLLGHSEKALCTISAMSSFVDSDDYEWLLEYSRKNFNGVVIYSLLLKTLGELEDYYLEMADIYTNEKEFYIYHNLATRLFFLDHIEKALEYVELALVHDKQAESYVLKGLCYEKQQNIQESQKAFKRAARLEPDVFSLLRRNYTQSKLLLLINA